MVLGSVDLRRSGVKQGTCSLTIMEDIIEKMVLSVMQILSTLSSCLNPSLCIIDFELSQ